MGQDEPRRVADRYRLVAVLGRGGMGTVWRAEDEVLGRPVAVKVIDAEAETAQRALREARAAGRLNHPGCVIVHDIVAAPDSVNIIMELIEAPTLGELVRVGGPLPPARAAAVGRQLLDILETAHAEGIVHRDVKPSNVMVLPGDRVKLTDFGIAALRGDPDLTSSGTTIGTPAYMAPEQAAGAEAGPPADLWSLGATLYYAVEGRKPFARPTPIAVLAAIMNDPPDPPERAGALRPVLDGLLVRPPGQRLDAGQVRHLLAVAAAGVGPGGTASGRTVDGGTASGGTVDGGTVDGRTVDGRTVDGEATVQLADPAYGTPDTVSTPARNAGSPPRPGVQDRPLVTTAGAGSSGQGVVRVTDRPRSRALTGALGLLGVTVAALGFAWLPGDDPATPQRPATAAVQEQAGPAAPADQPAAKPAGPEELPLAPSPANAASDGLGLGSIGREDLRELTASPGPAAGQTLPDNYRSVTNSVGGYAVGILLPSIWDIYAVGPTTYLDWDEPTFQAGYEVHSYQSVDRWTRLRQDERTFAAEHRADGYTRIRLTRDGRYAGRPAAVWEFTWQRDGRLTHARQVAFEKGSRTYTVLYRSADDWWLQGGSSAYPVDFERAFTPL